MKITVDSTVSEYSIEHIGSTSENYDGHCLRAYSYFPEELPLIHLAEPDEKCYKVVTDKATYYLTESDIVAFQENTFRGKDFFEFLQSRK